MSTGIAPSFTAGERACSLSVADRRALRELARQVREIASGPVQAEKRRRAYAHNALEPGHPIILCFPEGAWAEILPESGLVCEDPLARQWEHQLRSKVLRDAHLKDDNPIEPFLDLPYVVQEGNFGVEIPLVHGDQRGSYTWDPPLKNLPTDFGRLSFRNPQHDVAESLRQREIAEDLVGDLLTVRQEGPYWWTAGLTWRAIDLVGLEPLMLLMVDDPESVHHLMGWLRDEMHNFMDWYESEGLLHPNTFDQYVGSGGMGYTTEIPAPEGRCGLQHRWGFAESQETVGVSPAMFEEFVLPYQLPLLNRFALNCYGCCEPVHMRWNSIKTVPRLRRVSVSPWCDQEFMAQALGKNYIFSRKPNPTLVCTSFNEEAIRDDLRKTLRLAGAGVLEIILKDTHTVHGDVRRLSRWIELAREEVEAWHSATAY